MPAETPANLFVRADRPLAVSTPLGDDVLLITKLAGTEEISRLFHFRLDLLHERGRRKFAVEELLGQKITVDLELPFGGRRYFSGIANSVTEGERGTRFTWYQVSLVPELWLSTQRIRTRVFQHQTVPQIITTVLSGIRPANELTGTFEPRNYCVQYRESDFDFVSRLMEEEGIFYFFRHSVSGHVMVLANSSSSYTPVSEPETIAFAEAQGAVREDDTIIAWRKRRNLKAGSYRVKDYSFQLPDSPLETESSITDTVRVGETDCKLRAGGNDTLEIYDYPGDYVKLFDGIKPGGQENVEDLNKIYPARDETVKRRIERQETASLEIEGESDCGNLCTGHKFTLKDHHNANGRYVITSVQHQCSLSYGSNRSGQVSEGFTYWNTFTCLPAAMAYRPERRTRRPVIQSCQTATVVGPSGQDIFTDKYGRVKVQFHWDREGANDENSSCWVRVGTVWAGGQWGAIHIPRIGQEVIVAFEDGDPDKPLIVGSVYNARTMPPYTLPDKKNWSGIKSRSTLEGQSANFNEIRFEDTKDSERIVIHAEKDKFEAVEHDSFEHVGNDRVLNIVGNQKEKVKGAKELDITGDQKEKIGGDLSLQVTGTRHETAGQSLLVSASQAIYLKAGTTLILEAGSQLSLKGPGGFIDIGASGIAISGTMVNINSGGAAGNGTAPSAQNPEVPDLEVPE